MITAFASPQVKAVSFFDDRDGFTYPSETYKTWVVLGCVEGAFNFSIGDGPVNRCEAGQFLLCPPGVPLKRRSLGRISFYFIVFRWPRTPIREWTGRHELLDLGRMQSTLEQLRTFREVLLTGEASRWSNHLLADLLHQRAYEHSVCLERAVKAPDREMVLIAESLQKNLGSTDNLETLADEFNMSPSQLSRRFAAAFGMPPVAYRTNLRMHKARRLLTETALKLQAVAIACGYENAFYFTRVFTRETGQAPGRYRKTRRV